MNELLRRGHIYIAQPPLYQIIKGKKSQYVLNERQLDKTLTELGLEGSSLLVRDIDNCRLGEEPATITEISGHDAEKLVRHLTRLGELVEIAERRGIKFVDLLSSRREGKLPTHKVATRSTGEYAWSESEALDIIAKNSWRHADDIEADDNADELTAGMIATVRELHENKELAVIFDELGAMGIDINDFGLVQEESVTGQRLPARFAWSTTKTGKAPKLENEEDDTNSGAADAKIVEAENIPAILGALHQIGRRGMEVKRFKGLGEMDAEQLWETTMDQSVRSMFRVQWDQAGEADNLFSLLMGEQVEPRRKYIEDHALEVKNLDV
jgi:DNA gyrase subunit B